MFSDEELQVQLHHWATILGDEPRVGPVFPARELWPVTATDGRRFFLKRLGPWRNIPVADQARIQSYLRINGVRVAEFMITDTARLFAGEVEDSFVLLPHLSHDQLDHSETLAFEPTVGRSVAELHAAGAVPVVGELLP